HALFEQLGDQLHAASALNTLGLIANWRGEHQRSRAYFEASVESFRAADVDEDRRARNLAVVIDNLGSAAHELGDDATSMVRYEEARAINVARDDQEGVAMNDLHIA